MIELHRFKKKAQLVFTLAQRVDLALVLDIRLLEFVTLFTLQPELLLQLLQLLFEARHRVPFPAESASYGCMRGTRRSVLLWRFPIDVLMPHRSGPRFTQPQPRMSGAWLVGATHKAAEVTQCRKSSKSKHELCFLSPSSMSTRASSLFPDPVFGHSTQPRAVGHHTVDRVDRNITSVVPASI